MKAPAPPKRTPEDAMREFEYACRIWFACMLPADRAGALKMAAQLAEEVEYEPSRPPRSP